MPLLKRSGTVFTKLDKIRPNFPKKLTNGFFVLYCNQGGEKVIHKLASKLTEITCSNKKISPSMIEVYTYGFEIAISSFLNFVLVLSCGIVIGDILASIIYLFVFIFLRLFTGGYHATSYLRCNIVMVVSFLLTFALYRTLIWLNSDIRILEAILLADAVPIILFAPVKNSHKELTPSKVKKFQVISIVIFICLSGLSMTAVLFEIKYGTLMIVTLTAVSVMILVEIFMQRRGFHES